MKIEIELTDKQVKEFLCGKEHTYFDSNIECNCELCIKDEDPSCCHCELCGTCSSTLGKVRESVLLNKDVQK